MGSSTPPDLTTRILRRQQLVIAGGIALLVAISWWFLANGAGMPQDMDMAGAGMAGMDMAGMPPPPFQALVLMWWLMMVAMMLPSAAPAVLLYARVRASRQHDAQIAPSWVFLAGYLGVWLLFSIAAAFAQQLLTGPAMRLEEPRLGAAVLIAAGLYQLSPVKSACLSQCRSPAQFISRHWRAGTLGAARLGIFHGAYCVGCCWVLMALLFVGGIMNFAWIAALTLMVAVEKLVPRSEWLGRAAGIALILWGAARLAA